MIEEGRRALEGRVDRLELERGVTVASLEGAQRLWPVVAFTAVYLGAALLLALARGNQEFLFYIVVMLLLIGMVWAVHRSVRLSGGALWCLSLWGLAHMAGGLLVVPADWPAASASRVLYTLWLVPGRLKYDHVVHAYGFGVTTWVCWQGLSAAIRRRGGLAVPTTNVGGYRNTGWDLVANSFGATTTAALIWLAGRRGSGGGPEAAPSP